VESKKFPLRFSYIFPKRLGIFSPKFVNNFSAHLLCWWRRRGAPSSERWGQTGRRPAAETVVLAAAEAAAAVGTEWRIAGRRAVADVRVPWTARRRRRPYCRRRPRPTTRRTSWPAAGTAADRGPPAGRSHWGPSTAAPGTGGLRSVPAAGWEAARGALDLSPPSARPESSSTRDNHLCPIHTTDAIVASASAVWTEFATSSRRPPTDSVDNLETDQTNSIAVYLREVWPILITFSTTTSLCCHLSPTSIAQQYRIL